MKIDKEYRFQADLFRGASIRDFWSGERIRRAIDGTARRQKAL
jgi:hypothetical protein